MVRLIMRVEIPDPDLKDKHLLIRAAPFSSMASLAEPALGYVMVTVEVEQAFSVTTISPFESVETEPEVALAGSGFKEGSLIKNVRKIIS